MSSFFTQYENQLVGASRRLNPSTPRGTWRPTWLRRSVLIPVVAVAVVTPALAATQPWRPILGDSKLGPPATVSGDQLPSAETDNFAVLRRAQTDQDQGAATQAALRYFGDTAQGVHTSYIRRLSDVEGGAAVLVPVDSYTPLDASYPEALRQRMNVRDALCLFYPAPNGDGGTKSCYTVAQITGGEAIEQLGLQTYGLVPDGVNRVQAEYTDGQKLSGSVDSNFYDLAGPADSAMNGASSLRVNRITWFDASGRPINTFSP